MKRPSKPRISKPHLKWTWKGDQRGWRPFHRTTWLENGKRKERAIQLDWKGDAKELDRLYWACEAGRHSSQIIPNKYTWRECVEAWRADPTIQKKLAESTKKSYRPPMEAILLKNGGKAMSTTTRQDLRSAHQSLSATPKKADRLLQTISLLWNFAAEQLDWPLGPNPAKGINHFGKQREFEPWPDWMVGKLADAPMRVQVLARLILGTGQRPGAAVGMRRDQFEGEWMVVRDEKGKQKLEVYCPQPLREFIADLPIEGQHLLPKNLTEPLTYQAVETTFRIWRKSLGEKAKPYSLHGLRKLSIIQLAEAGASDAEIQAVTGQSAEMVAYYRAKANRKALSKSAQKRRE
ncbi:tyrosine-type recombinase/integrase [Sulfitobacter sp.]|uniref:tyrosine-type recombinase/integrase n=1 Tax=Sulfitobacter sp. TaxID=1903071 RepID=UPI003EF6E9CD